MEQRQHSTTFVPLQSCNNNNNNDDDDDNNNNNNNNNYRKEPYWALHTYFGKY